jgi:hypothetical protein
MTSYLLMSGSGLLKFLARRNRGKATPPLISSPTTSPSLEDISEVEGLVQESSHDVPWHHQGEVRYTSARDSKIGNDNGNGSKYAEEECAVHPSEEPESSITAPCDKKRVIEDDADLVHYIAAP